MHKINALKTQKASQSCPISHLHLNSREELGNAAPPRNASWITAGLLVWGEVVGAGVLGLPKAFGNLGWMLGIISLIFWLLINLKVGTIMAEIVSYYPSCVGFGDTVHHTFGKQAGKAASFFRNFFFALALGDYVLISSRSLAMLFYDEAQTCFVIWTVIVGITVFSLLQVRVLNGMRYLVWVNVITIFIAIFTALGTFTAMGSVTTTQEWISKKSSNNTCSSCSSTEIIPGDLSLETFFQAQSLIAFAYVGLC
jgi:amino acid permease